MQMERDHAAELTQGAQEAMSALRETYDRKKAEAEPHRQQRKELKETAQRTADKFRCVGMPFCEGDPNLGRLPNFPATLVTTLDAVNVGKWSLFMQCASNGAQLCILREDPCRLLVTQGPAGGECGAQV